MSLADYLAKNYLSADKKPKKKKKKSEKTASHAESAVVLENEDVLGWEGTPVGASFEQEDDDEDLGLPQTTGKEAKEPRWKRLGGKSGDYTSLSQAKIQKEPELDVGSRRSGVEQGREEDSEDPSTMMSNGARAGLQTAEQVREAMEKRQQAELARFLNDDDALSRQNAKTIYRDASGRVIDLAAQNNEKAKQEALEKVKKEARQRERQLGAVQKLNQEAHRQQLSEAGTSSINIHADDRELNEEQKSQYRFNDPAARFSRSVKQQKEQSHGQTRTSATGLPNYRGPYNPNRFNIPPGVKWDGVDRSNGFEALYLKKQNERREKKALSYSMAIDD
ncbi:Bud13p [Sugiyamaella lignohabitans]|uniref:Pre-mRNA-splicing factor CWC26 n=1 Tax=Sugiyamaella lignohabitans TaxID=796027 RepID=A0A167CV25_9ASCO|nr:Bud13p [Sugiyamaella lignohabitans]ANB12140.1 Bud13p [Sugiyamaella lignohabitans]